MKIHTILFLIMSMGMPLTSQNHLLSVSGYVKNQATGDIKKNITVFESFSGVGTITNTDGYFKLLLNPGNQNLGFSSSGFITNTFTFNLKNDTIISIELIPLNSGNIQPGLEHSLKEERSPKQNAARKSEN